MREVGIISMRKVGLTAIIIITTLIGSAQKNNTVKRMLKSEFVMLNKENKEDSIERFICKYETSNFQFLEFIFHEKKDKDQYVNSENWIIQHKDSTYYQYYLEHPAYRNYPVVNVSKEAIGEYCKWLEKRLNSSKSKYQYRVRLPRSEEFIEYSSGKDKTVLYAWGTNEINDDYCNFNYDDFDRQLDKTSNVKAHKISERYRLYNLNGNVAELTSDDIVCGGSWNSSKENITNFSNEDYINSSCEVGFRILIEKIDKNED